MNTWLNAGFLSPKSRRLYFLGCLFYNVILTKTPSYLSQLFIIDESIRRSNRSNIASSHFNIPLSRKINAIYEHSFSISAVRVWNLLPAAVRLASSKNMFKNKYEKFLKKIDRDISVGIKHPIYTF